MIAVENRYHNNRGAVSLLISITVALLSFNLAFNAFYCFGFLETEQTLAFFRGSVYILTGYLLLFAVYRVILRFLGINYALTMSFTSLSFASSAVAGYSLSRAAFNWDINRLIENPLGFDPVLRRALSLSFRYFVYAAVFYAVFSLIPAIRQRPLIMGRFWILNLLAPLAIVPFLFYVIVFVPEDVRVGYAGDAVTVYLTLMFWLTLRFLLKTTYYLFLPSEQDIKIEDIPEKRGRRAKRQQPVIQPPSLDLPPPGRGRKAPVYVPANPPVKNEPPEKADTSPAKAPAETPAPKTAVGKKTKREPAKTPAPKTAVGKTTKRGFAETPAPKTAVGKKTMSKFAAASFAKAAKLSQTFGRLKEFAAERLLAEEENSQKPFSFSFEIAEIKEPHLKTEPSKAAGEPAFEIADDAVLKTEPEQTVFEPKDPVPEQSVLEPKDSEPEQPAEPVVEPPMPPERWLTSLEEID